MKKNITYLFTVLAVVAVTLTPKHTFTMQYVIEKELITETFKSPKEYNERAKELKDSGIICYLEGTH